MGFYSSGFGWHTTDVIVPPISLLTTFNAACPSGLATKDFVYITGPSIGGVYQVAKADITDYSKLPAVGVVIDKPTPTTCKIQWQGEVTIFSGLIPHKIYFLDTLGQASDIPPTPTTNLFIQVLGTALDTNVLLISPQLRVTKRIV
jgi:hypothetical protein